jgi:hypothetical protein
VKGRGTLQVIGRPPLPSYPRLRRFLWWLLAVGGPFALLADRIAHLFGFCLGTG